MPTLILRMNEGNPTVDLHANRLQTGIAGATIVTVSGGLSAIGNLRRGDHLYIIGHGSPAKLGGKTAAEIASLLASNGLHSEVAIELVACQSGSTGDPFALELKMQLVNNKILPAYVCGGTNNMQVKPDGTPFTKTPGPTGTEVLTGKQTVQTPWGPRTRNINPKYKTF